MKLYPVFILGAITLFVIAYASCTQITAVWRNPDNAIKNYKNICIAAITEKITNKK